MFWLGLKVEDETIGREEGDRLGTKDLTEGPLETGVNTEVGWRGGVRDGPGEDGAADGETALRVARGSELACLVPDRHPSS